MYTHPTAMRCRKQAVALDQRKTFSRTEIARQSVMSRKTLYKWLGRHEEAPDDPTRLEDRDREPAVMPNQTPLEWEMTILDYCRENPVQGAKTVSNELRTRELNPLAVGESAVRGVWRRNGLATPKARLEWIERQKPPEEITPWAADKEASKTRHLHAPHPGHVVCVDGKTIGRLLNIGRVYVQAGIDGNCRVAFAHLYQDKTADSAADFLEKVVAETLGLDIKMESVLTDNGKEYTGSSSKPTKHPFELVCQEHGLKHRRTKVKHPWTNGMAERFLQTICREFFAVALRQRLYTSLEELQRDLNKYLERYNTKRAHRGIKRLTPARALANYLKTA